MRPCGSSNAISVPAGICVLVKLLAIRRLKIAGLLSCAVYNYSNSSVPKVRSQNNHFERVRIEAVPLWSLSRCSLTSREFNASLTGALASALKQTCPSICNFSTTMTALLFKCFLKPTLFLLQLSTRHHPLQKNPKLEVMVFCLIFEKVILRFFLPMRLRGSFLKPKLSFL